jgi:hypothetical protein
MYLGNPKADSGGCQTVGSPLSKNDPSIKPEAWLWKAIRTACSVKLQVKLDAT